MVNRSLLRESFLYRRLSGERSSFEAPVLLKFVHQETVSFIFLVLKKSFFLQTQWQFNLHIVLLFAKIYTPISRYHNLISNLEENKADLLLELKQYK